MNLVKKRGSACKICNLRYKEQILIPVKFHNGSGNDFNLLYSNSLSRIMIKEK